MTRRILALTLSVLMILTVAVVFSSCGDNGPTLDGVYADESLKDFGMWTEIVFDGNDYTQKEYMDGEVYFETEGSYKLEGTTLTLTADGGGNQTAKLTEDMSSFTLDNGGDGFVFVKK